MFTAGRYNESLAVGEQAAELARAVGDQHTLVQAVWNRANILQMLGRLDEAQRAAHEVFSLVEVVGDLRCLMGVPRDMAYIHALRGTFGAGLRSLDRSIARSHWANRWRIPPVCRSPWLSAVGWLS